MPNSIILPIIALFFILIYFFARKNNKKEEDTRTQQQTSNIKIEDIREGIPKGKDEEYQVAINPCADGKPLMYTLTTCKHCHHLHDFLDSKNIEHHQVFVDHYEGPARQAIRDKVYAYNPRKSFPVMVFPCGNVVSGFRKSEICVVLGIDPT